MLCKLVSEGKLFFWKDCLRIYQKSVNISFVRSITSTTTLLQDGSEKQIDSNRPKRIFSGIQPTGVLHLGNYLGAVRKWVDLQNDTNNDCIYSIVDLHSMTLNHQPKTLYNEVLTMTATLVACGVDPEKSLLFQQSSVVYHANLNWVLTCLSSMARLSRFAQFREKSSQMGKNIPLGLYVYPILQTADILLYKASHVPVGADQRAHINLAAETAVIFNNKYGRTFPEVHALLYDESVAKIRSLRQPEKKMSKSEPNAMSRIDLIDSPDNIRKHLKKAVTDFTSEVYYDEEKRPGVSNLMAMHSGLTGETHQQIREECAAMESAQYKMYLADIVIEHLKPIREKTKMLLDDKSHLEAILQDAGERASSIAEETWKDVSTKIGIIR